MLSEEQIDLLTRLFQSRYGQVYAIARRYAREDGMVEDIIQQTYLDFLTGVAEKRWDLARDVGPLLCQIAKRKAQRSWRNREGRDFDAIEKIHEEMLLVYDWEDRDEQEKLEEEMQSMRHCLDKIPPRSRRIIQQHYFEGTTIKDIAEQEQKSASHLRNFLYRMREKLKICIEKSLTKR